MCEEAKIRKRLKGQVAAKPGLAAKALGLGKTALKTKIEAGIVPTNALGNIPVPWLLAQMRFSTRKPAA